MGDFAADTLRDAIVTAWSPANTRIPKAAGVGIEQIVHFLAHPEIKGAHEWPISLEIQKIMDPQVPDNENQTVHSRFTEVRHRFTISCRYRVRNTDETLFDQAQQDIEDMCVETVRILKTVYNPLAGTGAFFTARYNWSNNDNLTGVKQELVRTLNFELTQLQSQSTEVFLGYGGVLTFDVSASSNMATPPGADYIYTEAYDVSVTNEGSESITVMTRNSSSKTGKPARFRGVFSGIFRATMYAKKSDLNGTSADKLDNIYKAQTNGEHIEAAFLDAVTNTEGTPVTLTNSTLIQGIRIDRRRTDTDLMTYTITGDITTPTTTSVA